MEHLISIVVSNFDNNKYLTRCLNSIKQQINVKFEIIIVGYEEKKQYRENDVIYICASSPSKAFNKALKLAKGRYVFFINSSSVLQKNYLFELSKEKFSDKLAMGVHCDYDNSKVSYLEKILLEGKIFDLALIKKNNIHFTDSSRFTEWDFLTQYYDICNTLYINKNIYLYGSISSSVCNLKNEIKNDDLDNIVYMIANVNTLDCNYTKFWESFFDTNLNEEQIMKVIFNMSKKIKNYEFNFYFAKKYLSKIYDFCISNKVETIYENIRNYLSIWENDEAFLTIILELLNLNIEHFEIMKNHNLENFVFLSKHVSTKDDTDEKLMNNIKETIDVNFKELHDELTKTCCSFVASSTEKPVDEVVLKVMMKGPELSEYVIGECLNGGLGLKTIIKCLFAWVKYKI